MREATQSDVGKACVYFDPVGKPHDSVITAVWGTQCINLVYVVDDKDQTDTYGRKIGRNSSTMHGSVQQAHGNYWMWPGEERVKPQ